AAVAFRPATGDRWLADLYTLARRRLEAVGVRAVFGGGYCTYSEPDRFFSYRRDGSTGRMASLIWLDPATR
ncbi:MAG: laccase domain-containing protein, partial [Chromatiaceae bacterium]